MSLRAVRLRRRLLFLAPLFLFVACTSSTDAGSPSNPATETFAASLGVDISQMTKVAEGLYIRDIVVGTGTAVATGRNLSVFYTGWLANGTQFETNVGGMILGPFPIGVGRVIPGWDLGLLNMKVGGKRRLVIGSALAYGAGGQAPAIPPNATLVFDVQLVSVQ